MANGKPGRPPKIHIPPLQTEQSAKEVLPHEPVVPVEAPVVVPEVKSEPAKFSYNQDHIEFVSGSRHQATFRFDSPPHITGHQLLQALDACLPQIEFSYHTMSGLSVQAGIDAFFAIRYCDVFDKSKVDFIAGSKMPTNEFTVLYTG